MSHLKVLAIGGHPDDMEQFCGGTLLLLQRAGCETIIAPLTAGECGSNELSAEEIKKVRAKEIIAGAAKINAKSVCFGIRDGCVEYDLETTKKIVKLLREIQPDIVFTHPLLDYMTDHFHTGKLVLWAIPEAGHPNFIADTDAPALKAQPYLYQCDPQGLTGIDGQIARVNTIVDISDVIEEKLDAFQAHTSQMSFLKKDGGGKINNVEKTRRWAVTRGEQVRVEYAEGFNEVLLAEYPRKNVLVEILKERIFTL